MSVCPGCGRCRECGHPAPITPRPWPYVQPTIVQPYPWPYTITSPNTNPYYVGDPMPGAPGTITITCQSSAVL